MITTNTTKFRIAGHDITINIGMMRHLANAANPAEPDVLDPLKGITDPIHQAALILYAGKAQEAVSKDEPITFTREQAAAEVEGMSMATVFTFISTFNKVVLVALDVAGGKVEGDVKVQDVAEKKS